MDSTLPGAKDSPGGNVQYIVPAMLDELDEVIARAAGREPSSKFTSIRTWLIWANIIAVVIMVLIIIIRRSS